MERFEYNLSNLRQVGIALLLVAVAYPFVAQRVPLWFVIVAAFIYAGRELYPIARVSLDEAALRVDFLLPIRRGRTIALNAVQTYAPLRATLLGRTVTVGGILRAQDAPSLTLFSTGIQDFSRLSEILEHRFPRETQVA
jgi:hypothetical protein